MFTLKKQAFTLVELIVVITIIAILGTIAFITMQGYSASSRDSVRISDMSKISSSLELFNIDAGKYPDPTELQPVTYSGGLAWNQGIFGNVTFTNVSRLDKIPKDPLTEKEYAFSVLNTKQAFEIGSILEGNGVALNINNEVNAFEKTAKAKITGTYNGISLRVNANNISYVLAVPSILTSIDLEVQNNRKLEVIVPANELVLDNYSNLPSNYIGTSYDSNKETTNPDFKLVNNILLYEGDIANLTSAMLVARLQQAYSGTSLALTDATNELFQIDVTSGSQLEKIDNYGKNFINNNLGGSAVNRIYNTCGLFPHNTMQSYYSAASVGFGVSCDTVKKDFTCIDGTWTDTVSNANFSSYPLTECEVAAPLNCNYLSTPINHGDSIDVYSESTIAWNATYDCPNRIGLVTCNNGVLSGNTTYGFKTCTKGTPTNCTANPSYLLNGHTYNVIQLNHNISSTPTVDISENNGIFRYTFNALCNDGTIIGNETGPVKISCNANYTWNGVTLACEANTQLATCGGTIVSNATATTATTYSQLRNGTAWTPTTNWQESQETCDFNCNTNYTWNGSICAANTQTTTCGGSIVANATATTATTYSQLRNGIAWTPTTNWGEFQSTCDFNCNESYTWNGTNCVLNTQIVACTGKPINSAYNNATSITQTWNGTTWLPSTISVYNITPSTTECRYICTNGYTGTNCEITPALITQTTCESANWIWVASNIDVNIGTTQGNGFCISPRFGDWNSESTLGNGGISWNGWGNVVNTYYQGWDASEIDDSLNSSPQFGQTRILDSEISYNCKPLGTAGSDYDTSDTIIGRMKWLATTGNSYTEARSIDWIIGLVPHSVGTYPHAIPALFLSDCIDGVKDLGTTMIYKHIDDTTDEVTYDEYKTDPVTDPDSANLSDVTYQNRQKYLTAWTQKTGSHLPSAMSYITSGKASANDPDGDFLTTTSRGEYQVACEAGKFGAVTYNGTTQYIGANDDVDNEHIWLSAISDTTGINRGKTARIVGVNGCGDQNNDGAGNRNSPFSSRFIVRP